MPRRDNPTQLLNQMVIDIVHTRRIADKRLNNLRLAGDPLQGTDYDKAGGKGGISDPTPTHAEQLEQWHRHYDDAIQAVIVAAGAVAHMRRVLDKAPSEVDVAKIVEQQRCTGGMGMDGSDEWGKPECREVYDRAHGHNQGLCSACIRRRNRWEQDQQAVAS